jgi:hypothetical protein
MSKSQAVVSGALKKSDSVNSSLMSSFSPNGGTATKKKLLNRAVMRGGAFLKKYSGTICFYLKIICEFTTDLI